MNYQKLYEKHPSSINLTKNALFRDTSKFLRTAIKNAYVGVFLLKKHTI